MQTSQNSKTDNPGMEKERVLYRTVSTSPLRILSGLAWVFALGSCILAVLLVDRAVHFSSAVSMRERWIWAIGLVVVFGGFFIGVVLYKNRIVIRIGLLPGGRELRVTTPSLLGIRQRIIKVDDVVVARYHGGDRAGEEATSPPWLWVQVRGQRSFVLSLTGHMPHQELLLNLLKVEVTP